MATPRERLESEILSLPQEDRVRLVQLILISLESEIPAEDQAEVDAAWAEEIQRRVEDLRSGRVRLIPGDEVFKELGDLTS